MVGSQLLAYGVAAENAFWQVERPTRLLYSSITKLQANLVLHTRWIGSLNPNVSSDYTQEMQQGEKLMKSPESPEQENDKGKDTSF
jgi:hypothetical protein